MNTEQMIVAGVMAVMVVLVVGSHVTHSDWVLPVLKWIGITLLGLIGLAIGGAILVVLFYDPFPAHGGSLTFAIIAGAFIIGASIRNSRCNCHHN